MALAAKELGLKYLGFGDHSQSLTVANGLSPERVRKQQAEIDALSKQLKGIHLSRAPSATSSPMAGWTTTTRCWPPSITSWPAFTAHFKQTRQEMTARIVRAVRHPLVTMLGHATGRLLLRRDGYKVDLEAVLQAAAESGTMIEINAHPVRLDLDWVHCKRAKALGVKLVINPDAHSTRGAGSVPLRRRRRPARLAGEGGRVQHAERKSAVQKKLAKGKK